MNKRAHKNSNKCIKKLLRHINDLHQGLFCMLLPYKHRFFQAKHNSYYKRALLLQTLVQTAMEIFLSYFLSFDKKEKFAFLIPCNKRNL